MSQHVEAVNAMYTVADYCLDEEVGGLDAPDREPVLYIGNGDTALVVYGTREELLALATQIMERVTPERERLEYLRAAIREEHISWGEIAELQSLAEFIDPGDVELLEWAGVPEFEEEESVDMPRLRALLAEPSPFEEEE